jgi:predicted DNA-binding transcriptional regulator YafY
MRASRLLRLLMLLQTRGRTSAAALAEALEVSVRTVHRDVDELTAAGVPVWADRGRAGGFQLEPGWRTRMDGLTSPEAQALFLGGLPGPAAELGLGEAMASAHLKLLATLPEGWREDARRVGTRFHLDPLDGYRGPAASDPLPAVAHAVWHELCIDVRYESWSAVVERRLEPLGLVLKAGVWYLVARAAGARGRPNRRGASRPPARDATRRATPDDGVRTYRVAGIQSLATAGTGFERPAGFDLAAWWQASIHRFESELYREQAVLRISTPGLQGLSHHVTAAQLQAAEAGAGRPDAAGWRRVTLPIESIAHGAAQVLRLGVEVKVLRPAALRREVLRRVDAVARVYRG